MSQPLNKVGRELILDLINRTNRINRPLTFSDVQFSLPVVIPNAAPGTRNTEMTVYPAPGSNFIRSKVVSYWRLDIGQLLQGELSIIGITEDTIINDTNDVIGILNDRYNLKLTEEDVEFEEVTLSTIPGNYTLRMRDESYAYINQVELTFSYDLAQVIFVNVLDGLHYPEEATVENASPFYVNDQDHLLVGTGLLGRYNITSENGESEAFIGIHRTGAGNAYVDPVGNVFTIPLANNRHWSFTFGVGLLETVRGSVITDLYDIELDVRHENGQSFSATLVRVEDSLAWSIEGVGPVITDNKPSGSLMVAQNSQRTFFYAPFFSRVPTNGVGAHLGRFTIRLQLKPKRAIYISEIDLTVIANIIAA